MTTEIDPLTSIEPTVGEASAVRYLPRWLAFPTVQAALILSALLVVFLWVPISSGGYYAATDLMNPYALFHVPPTDYRPKNTLLSDTVDVMFPFVQWNRVLLASGQLPVWNPYNGAGAPHLANYQSAVFSPYSLPFYLLDFRIALIVSAFIKLFSLGFFTYLFLRQVQVGHGPALVGSVAFMFCGYHLVWLHWVMVATCVALPMGFYFAELALQSRGEHGKQGLALIGFTLALCIGLLTGHPETFFYNSLLLGAYIIFRVLQQGMSWGQRLRQILLFGLTSLAALAVSAVQLLPFLEYLRESAVFASRSGVAHYGGLPRLLLPLGAFPDLLGNRALNYADPVFNRVANYNEINGSYVGLIALFLAALAVITFPSHRRPLVAFFAGACALWFMYVYNVAGVGTLIASLPIFKVLAHTRSYDIWTFSLSCLAALGVDILKRRAINVWPATRHSINSSLLLMGLASLWALTLLMMVFIGAYLLVQWATMQPGNQVATWPARYTLLPHMLYISLTFIIAVGCVIFLIATRHQGYAPRSGTVAVGALVLLVFLQTGFLLKDYNPTIDARYFYPVTSNLTEVMQGTGDAPILGIDGGGIIPNTNLWYQFRHPANYDGIGVRAYEQLYLKFLRTTAPSDITNLNPINLRALQALGIQYVTSARPNPFKDVAGLEPIWSSDLVRLFRVPGSLPRYFTVGRAIASPGDAETMQLMLQPDIDLNQAVVIQDAPANQWADGNPGSGIVQVLAETPTAIQLRVERDAPGWLVALQAFYPGWKASVNGATVPLVRANMAFTGLHLNSGVSDVTLEYDPLSVKVGLWISGLAVVALFIITYLCIRSVRHLKANAAEAAY